MKQIFPFYLFSFPKSLTLIKKLTVRNIFIIFIVNVMSACGGSNGGAKENQAPIATGDVINVPAGANYFVDVLSNDKDADNDILTITSITQAKSGIVKLNNNQIHYQPRYTYKGADSFSYTISDGEYEVSAIVTIDVLFDELDQNSIRSFAGQLGQPTYANNYLYIPQGSLISIWDMSTPTAPDEVFKTSLAPTKGAIKAITVVGNYLYATVSGSGDGYLAVYSLVEPDKPQLITEFNYAPNLEYSFPQGLIQVSENLLYLFDSENGLFIVDINSPESPSVASILPLRLLAEKVKIFDSLLITTGKNMIGGQNTTFVDINDLYAPIKLNTVISDGSAAFNKDTLIISTMEYLQFYDTSTPYEPILVHELELVEHGYSKLSVNNNTVYYHRGSEVDIYDISKSTKYIKSINVGTTDVGRQEISTPLGQIFLSHDDRGVLLNGDSIDNIQLISQFELSGGNHVSDIAVTDEGVLAVQGRYGVTSHQKTNFNQTGRLDIQLSISEIASYASIELLDNTAYIANWGSGLVIADISIFDEPKEIGRINLGYVSDVAVDPAAKVALLGQVTNSGKLYVVDVADPKYPELITEYDFPQVNAISYYNGNFFVASSDTFGGNAGLTIVDLSDPQKIEILGYYDCGYNITRLIVENNLALMACNDELHIVDITNTTTPFLLGKIKSNYSSTFGAMAILRNRAFLGHSYGIDEVNIADPSNPRLIKTIFSPGSSYRLKTSLDGELYYLGLSNNYIFKDKQ